MTGRAPDTSAAAAIRDASVHGQAKAVRELLDALHKARPRDYDAAPAYEGNDEAYKQQLERRDAWLRGFDEAVRIVKAYRVDDRPGADQ